MSRKHGPTPVDVSALSVEELQTRLQSRLKYDAERQKRYYENNIKTDPEKYQKYLEKCNRNNKARYQRLKAGWDY
jgi:hypothetical protein